MARLSDYASLAPRQTGRRFGRRSFFTSRLTPLKKRLLERALGGELSEPKMAGEFSSAEHPISVRSISVRAPTSNDTGGNVLNPSAGVLKESITGKRRQIVLFVKKRADVYVFRIWDQFEVFASKRMKSLLIIIGSRTAPNLRNTPDYHVEPCSGRWPRAFV